MSLHLHFQSERYLTELRSGAVMSEDAVNKKVLRKSLGRQIRAEFWIIMGTAAFSVADFSCRAHDLHHLMQRVSHVDLDLLLREVDWNGGAYCPGGGKVRRSASKQRRLFEYMATGDPWGSRYPASIQDILEGYGEESEEKAPRIRKTKMKKKKKKINLLPSELSSSFAMK